REAPTFLEAWESLAAAYAASGAFADAQRAAARASELAASHGLSRRQELRQQEALYGARRRRFEPAPLPFAPAPANARTTRARRLAYAAACVGHELSTTGHPHAAAETLRFAVASDATLPVARRALGELLFS